MSEYDEYMARIFQGGPARVKVITGTGLHELLEALTTEFGKPETLTREEVEALNSRGALEMAVSAASSADTSVRRGKLEEGQARRELAEMWMDLHECLKDQEEADGVNPALEDARSRISSLKAQLDEAKLELQNHEVSGE